MGERNKDHDYRATLELICNRLEAQVAPSVMVLQLTQLLAINAEMGIWPDEAAQKVHNVVAASPRDFVIMCLTYLMEYDRVEDDEDTEPDIRNPGRIIDRLVAP